MMKNQNNLQSLRGKGRTLTHFTAERGTVRTTVGEKDRFRHPFYVEYLEKFLNMF